MTEHWVTVVWNKGWPSNGIHSVHGPFDTMEQAKDFGEAEFPKHVTTPMEVERADA